MGINKIRALVGMDLETISFLMIIFLAGMVVIGGLALLAFASSPYIECNLISYDDITNIYVKHGICAI